MNINFIKHTNKIDFTMEPIHRAKTIHPFPIPFMLNTKNSSSSSSTNVNEFTIMKRGRLQSSINNNDRSNSSDTDMSDTELSQDNDINRPSWESREQLNEETIEKLDQVYNIPHSIFTTREKYIIVILGGISGLWSSISSPIYLPVLPILSKFFEVDDAKMNITVVVYSIFQGISPIVFSNLSDKLGRRFIILCCLLIYILANIGLALNNSFTGLVLLRCLQAFGISSTLSVSLGIASDITTKSDRASFIGLSTGLSLSAQGFGSLLGGILANKFTFRGIFWFLAIGSGITLVVNWFCLPETSRNLVGNGSSLPTKFKFITVTPILHLKHFSKRRVEPNPTILKSKNFNMLIPFKILKCTPVILILFPASISYALWLMMLTTLSTSLSNDYQYSTSKIAIAYIPSGVGGVMGSVIIGKLLDWSYKRNYKKFQQTLTKFKEDSQLKINNNYPKFNIFRARLILTILPISLSVVGSLLFGWALQYNGPVALLYISSFLISFGAMNFLTISTTILIDLFPLQSSGSSSCVNLTRCWCAALFIGILTIMIDSMTVAGCYSFMAGLCCASSLCIVYLVFKSDKWI